MGTRNASNSALDVRRRASSVIGQTPGSGRKSWGFILHPSSLILFLLLAAPLAACYGPEYSSVRFHSSRPDFFRMPQPWRGVPSEKRALDPRTEAYYDASPDLSPVLMRRALNAEGAGRFHEAAELWVRYRRIYWSENHDFTWEKEPPVNEGLADRVLALRAWRGAADTPAVRAYLQARAKVTNGDWAAAAALLPQIASEPLRVHGAYLRATMRFRDHRSFPDASAHAYQTVLQRWPHHVPSLYMTGRCYLGSVLAVDGDVDAPMPPRGLTGPIGPRARHLRQALVGYERCAAEDRSGFLGEDARGMAAACYFRLENYPEALLRYCRLLAEVPPAGDRGQSLWLSTRECLKRMAAVDHRTFQQRAAAEPTAAAVYLDLMLQYGRISAGAHYRLGLFALEVLKRKPSAPLNGRLLTRLALIEDRLGNPSRAERLAAEAEERAGPGPYRDQAAWQRAVALQHTRRDREALAAWERLAGRASIPRFRRAAHEAAAVLCEQLHDYPNALRHYFSLEYRMDYAYILDCLAADTDLLTFLRRFPGHPKARVVRYSLGYRQLRSGRYEAAVATFASLGLWVDDIEGKLRARTSRDKPRMHPLQAARYLSHASRAEAGAKEPRQKARIAYEAAALIFHQRHLLFYNGALWASPVSPSAREPGGPELQTGNRTWTFDLQWPPSDPRRPGATDLTPEEQRVVDRYQEEHAPLYQALRRFEEIAGKYPHTPEAPKALYSAALCYTLLPSLEAYWTRRMEKVAEPRAIALYRRLQRDYPTHPLARAAARFGGPLPGNTEKKP